MKRLSLTLIAVAALAIFGLEDRATASPITYTVSTIGSGHLGSTAFTNSLVTLTLVADTSGITTLEFTPEISILVNVGTATVTIAGIGTATITDPVEAFSTYNLTAEQILLLSDGDGSLPTVGIATFAGGDFTHILLTSSSDLFGYDLKTPLNVSGTGFPCCGSPEHHTSRGILTFSDVSVRDTSLSVAVPEPSSILLLAAGAMGLFGIRRRF